MQKLKFTTLLLASAIGATATQAATVKMECATSGNEKNFCEYVGERFTRETGHKVEFVELPASSSEKLGLFQQIFASGESGVVDVFQVDVVWPGILSQHLLTLDGKFDDLKPIFFSSAWQNNIINGELKAIPGFVDTGVMYYRSDLLEKYGEKPPTTWTELEKAAERIQKAERKAGNDKFWGYVFQGKAYEGLTCNAIEWVSSFGGGSIVDADGNITINNKGAAAGLDAAAGWVGTISPKGVMGYQEEESRAVFQNGDALFMRNWPYAYILAQGDDSKIKDKIGIVPVPKGGKNGQYAAALGGWQWGISKYTDDSDAAIALVRMLSDKETQVQRFLLGGATPARADAYDDPRVIKSAPHMADLLPIFEAAVARPASPTGDNYARVSNAFFNATFAVLNGEMTGKEAVADIETRLTRIKRNGW